MILHTFVTAGDDRKAQSKTRPQQNNVIALIATKNDRAIKMLETAIKSLNTQIENSEDSSK